ncbi:amidase [Actinomyces qiguomingii]|uniref:amidase n=1 Tax=Actinomyces qiguomingii TaxID=2057800 RepID=UPI0013047E33|nr:amidase family protein [Actinomyces qiguomingii]
MDELTDAVGIARAVRAGRLTAGAAVAAALDRIDALAPELNAFTLVRHEAARREAAALDRLLNAVGPEAAGPLAGVPVAVKEEYDVAGEVTTLGGRGNSSAARADCAVVRRLRRAGAILVGRTNMPEFGQFPVGESAFHGDCLNPWDNERSPGGSSAGSAVAVATGAVPIALGADGGGSLRIPASACGVLGLKPTRGRVSSAPLSEHWFGLAGFGAITRTARDMAAVMDVISGNEAVDRWRLDSPERRFSDAVTARPRRLRILLATNPVMPGARTTPPVARAMRDFTAALRRAGHDVRQARVAWPVPTMPFLTLYFAGMRAEAQQVEHPDRLEPRTGTSVRLGSLIPQPVVRAALRHAERVRDGVEAAFGRADLLLLPTLLDLPGGAHDLHGRSWLSAMLASTPAVSNTAIFNVSGHPALSVPAGVSHGLPVGAQLVARTGREDLLLAVAAQLHTH